MFQLLKSKPYSCRSSWENNSEVGEDWATQSLFFWSRSPWRMTWPLVNAMSTKWWTWLVEGSWRMPWPFSECHDLQTSIFLIFLQGGWCPMGSTSWRTPLRSPPVHFLHFFPVFCHFRSVFSFIGFYRKVPEMDTICQHNTIKKVINILKLRAYQVENVIHFMVIMGHMRKSLRLDLSSLEKEAEDS